MLKHDTSGVFEDNKPTVYRIPSNIDIMLGLQWAFFGDNPVDLDASCVMFNSAGAPIESVFFNNLKSEGDYVVHSGDNKTGEDAGDDDERIEIYLGKVPPHVESLMVCVTSYSGADFVEMDRATVRLVNTTAEQEVAKFELSLNGRHNASLLCALFRAQVTQEEISAAADELVAAEEALDLAAMELETLEERAKVDAGVDPTLLSPAEQESLARRARRLKRRRKEVVSALKRFNAAEALVRGGWWELREINIPCVGYTFLNLLPKMMEIIGIPPEERDKQMELLPEYSLEKAEDKTAHVLSQVKFGLGWDGENDLDACMVMLTESGRYVDHLYAKSGKTRCGGGADAFAAAVAAGALRAQAAALEAEMRGEDPTEVTKMQLDPELARELDVTPYAEHSGDKVNGFAVQGDDEYITVDLMRVPKECHVIYFMAVLYDGGATSLAAVPRCYARLVNKPSPVDRLYRFVHHTSLNAIDDDVCTALIPYAVVRRSAGRWELVNLAEPAAGRDWVGIFPLLRAITAVSVEPDRWAAWRGYIAPACMHFTIHGLRGLGPVSPDKFACHCIVWICDRHGVGRFRTSICEDRDSIVFEPETATGAFLVTKLDVMRVMVYETTVVAHVDIPMAEFYPNTPPHLSMDALTYDPVVHSQSRAKGRADGGSPPLSAGASATPPGATTPTTAAEAVVVGPTAASAPPVAAAPAPADLENAPARRIATSALAPLVAARRLQAEQDAMHRPPHIHRRFPPSDGDVLLDRCWLPLQGVDVAGAVCVSLRCVPMTESFKKRKAYAAMGSSSDAQSRGCAIM
jgi:stress response protein SCP2